MDGKNEPDTGRETGAGGMPFKELALFLAESYGKMLSDRERLKAVIDAGVQPYTEEMVIRDLSAVSVRYDTERVQTSNISNVPERIAELLDAGYMEKMNRRLEREMDGAAREYGYVCWKIEIVETAMRERMTRMQREVFNRVFVRHLSIRQVCRKYKKHMEFRRACAERDGAVITVMEELELVFSLCEGDVAYMGRLKKEAGEFGNREV